MLDLSSTVTEIRVPTIIYQLNLQLDLYKTLAAVRGYLLTGDTGLKAAVKSSWENISHLEAEVDTLSKKWIVEKNRERWTETKESMNMIKLAQEKSIQFFDAGARDNAIENLKTNAFPHVQKINSLSNELVDSQQKLMKENADKFIITGCWKSLN